jgi:hypothetical protein
MNELPTCLIVLRGLMDDKDAQRAKVGEYIVGFHVVAIRESKGRLLYCVYELDARWIRGLDLLVHH